MGQKTIKNVKKSFQFKILERIDFFTDLFIER